MMPPNNAQVSKAPSDTRPDPAPARILSRPNKRNVHKLTSANRPSALGRVRRAVRGMSDVLVVRGR